MFIKLKDNLHRISSLCLILLLAASLIEMIIMKALGTLIVPKLRVEKGYMIIISISLCVFVLCCFFELVFNKRFSVKKVILLVILLLPVFVLWPESDRSVLTIKNNGTSEIRDMEITDSFDKYTIKSIEVGEAVSIPIYLSGEQVSELSIDGKIASGETIRYKKELYAGWYTQKQINITVSSSENISYNEVDLK